MLLFAACAVAAAWFFVHAARAIAFPFPLDYGEGPLLDQARRLAAGQDIYAPGLDRYPLTIANYPPIVPALLASLRAVFGPSFAAARALTLVSATTCAWLVAAIVRRVTGARAAALAAAALFVASPYVVYWSTLVRVDFVALAFGLSAIAVVLRWPAARATPFAAAAIAACAVLSRQSHLLAAPCAITAALYAQKPPRALAFVAAFAGVVAAAVAALSIATNGGFLFHTVTANANAYSPSLLAFFFRDLALTTAPLAVVAGVAVRGGVSEDRSTRALVVAYLGGAALSALTIGKVGAHVNYFLELVAALSIAAGVALARAKRTNAIAIALAASCSWMAGVAAFRPEALPGKLRQRAELEALARAIDAEPRPILADEAMGVLAARGRPIEAQPFELAQLARAGRFDESRLVADIRAQRFGLVLLNDGPDTPASWVAERWSPAMLDAVHAAYENAGTLAGATLYRPRARP